MPYEYKFVELKRPQSISRGSSEQGHHETIREHAADGWRLVQIFSVGDSFGSPSYAEMIFERPAE